jgi:CubicO group peptidase (beta-lactamase class C family)
MKSHVPLALALLVGVAACASPAPPARNTGPNAEAPGPRFIAGGPAADELGAGAGYPKGDRATFYDVRMTVGSHSHLDEIFRSRIVRHAPTPSRLERAAEPRIPALDDYLEKTLTSGLLIARDETILVERYQYDRTDQQRLTSWSMAKTVTAMLVGIAVAEGRIRSIDDPASTYVPALAGREYGRTSIRHLLQMSSGVRFREQYSGSDDVTTLVLNTYMLRGPGGPGAVAVFNDRLVPAGTRFSYSSAEAQVLGLVLRGATGVPPADYLESRIWQPIGAEADATWLVDNAGQEATFCCVNAVLRDYARLGLLLAHEGNWRGRQLIPAAWVQEATTVRADQPHLRPGTAHPTYGYGYQTWILPGERRMFMFWGVRGQRIYVDPRSKLVMVNTGAHRQSVDVGPLRQMDALWAAVVGQLGG